MAALAAASRPTRRPARPAAASRPRARPRSRCRSRSSGCGSSTSWRGPSADLQHPAGAAADRARSTRDALRGRARRRGGAAREPAHRLPGDAAATPCQLILTRRQRRPRACGRDRSTEAEPARGAGRRRRGTASTSPASCRCGRSCSRSGDERARAAAGAAPHRRRRLVAGAAGARSRRAPTRRGCDGHGARLAAAAGPVRRLHALAARAAGRGERSGQRDRAPAGLLARDAGRSCPRSSRCRPTGRARRCRAIAATACRWRCRRRSCTRGLLALARRERRQPVHGAAGRAGGAAHAAGRGHRHPDRHARSPAAPTARSTTCRVLRQHPGAAHRPVGRPDLPRAARAGARRPTWRPSPTRTCRSSGWWRCSTRRARWRGTRCSR